MHFSWVSNSMIKDYVYQELNEINKGLKKVAL